MCCLLSQGTLYRSDFFPGLGWMLTAQLWNELKDDWPLRLLKVILVAMCVHVC